MGTFVSSDSTSNYPVEDQLAFFGEAAVSGLCRLGDELRNWPIATCSDQHKHPVQQGIRW